MNRDYVHYAIIAVAVVAVGATAAWYFIPEATESLDPPEVVAERLNEGVTVETKVEAARDLIRHGEMARVEVRTALAAHRRHEPEVIAPLLQATMKSRDHRSLPTVIELLEHPDPTVRGRAGSAVRKILGADFGFRANDPIEKRQEIIAKIRADFVHSGPRIQQFYEDQRQ
ncbi:MAG: hypothetical protein HQ581_15925 [Planctomycetes bacterium]|nr:hypothetical protein [Planctomycetota bacterium]